MRKELSKAVRAEFTAAMGRRLPQFVPVKIDSRYAWPNSRVFRWAYDDVMHFFVEMFFDPKGDDAFTVEVGWSRLGRYPEVSVRPGFRTGEEFAKAEYWCRLSHLYSATGGFWSLEEPDAAPGASGQGSGRSPAIGAGLPQIGVEEALTRVAPRVEDAVDKLVVHALPYLDEVARRASELDRNPR
jgi:hypothetical protein